jgi:sugar/nucleoside kinase (ribokinase family)
VELKNRIAFVTGAGRGIGRAACREMLKRGAAGAVARDAGGTVQVPGHAVAVVDPTGAGDCFCGTLVPLLAGGMALPDALVRANAAGALAVLASAGASLFSAFFFC